MVLGVRVWGTDLSPKKPTWFSQMFELFECRFVWESRVVSQLQACTQRCPARVCGIWICREGRAICLEP